MEQVITSVPNPGADPEPLLLQICHKDPINLSHFVFAAG